MHVPQLKLGNVRVMFPSFQNCAYSEGYLNLSLDIICSSKLLVLLELHSRITVRFWEQIMSADKYPSTFLNQMEAVVYIFPAERH